MSSQKGDPHRCKKQQQHLESVSHLCSTSDPAERLHRLSTHQRGIVPTPLHSTSRGCFSFEVPGSKESPFDTLQAKCVWHNLTHQHLFFLSKRMVKKVVCLLSKRDCLRELLHSSMKWDMPAELRRGNLCCLSWTIWLSTHPGSLEKKVKINTK